MIYRGANRTGEVRENMRGGNGRAVLTALSDVLPERMRLFSKISLMPGDSIGYHIHENETELFYFARGRARVVDDGTEHEVGEGDVMSTPNGSGHSVENIGDDELILIAVIVKD